MKTVRLGYLVNLPTWTNKLLGPQLLPVVETQSSEPVFLLTIYFRQVHDPQALTVLVFGYLTLSALCTGCAIFNLIDQIGIPTPVGSDTSNRAWSRVGSPAVCRFRFTESLRKV